MTEITFDVALPFVATDDGIVAGEPVGCISFPAVLTRAEALSCKEGHVGAVAFSRTGDPATGDFGDVQVIRKFGDVPDDLTMLGSVMDITPVKHDTGLELLQVEESYVCLRCQVLDEPGGERYLSFGGTPLPSLPHVVFGLCLKPETTQQEAQALADQINKHCPAIYGAFYNRGLTDIYYELNEHGLAKLD
jgi:hypothetical protein